MATANGDLVAVIGRLLDEKLRPIGDQLDSIKRLVTGLQGGVKRINARLMVVEARLSVVETILEIDPDELKH